MKHQTLIGQAIDECGLYPLIDAMWQQQKLKPDMERFKEDMNEIAIDIIMAVFERTRDPDIGLEAGDEWVVGQTQAWILVFGRAWHT